MYYGRLQEDMMSRSSIEQDAGNSGALPAVSWKKSAIICKPTIATSEGVCVYNICFTPIYRPLLTLHRGMSLSSRASSDCSIVLRQQLSSTGRFPRDMD